LQAYFLETEFFNWVLWVCYQSFTQENACFLREAFVFRHVDLGDVLLAGTRKCSVQVKSRLNIN